MKQTGNKAMTGPGLPSIVLGLIWAASQASVHALTIETKDMGYLPGHVFKYAGGNYSPAGLDLTEGTGKKWDFSSFSGSGYMNYGNIRTVSNVAGFPSATLAIDLDGKTLTSFSQTLYYKEQGGDWLNYGESVGGTAYPCAPYQSMGFPHTSGKTWSTAFSQYGASYTQNGKVIAEGTITTKMGSFPALLVRLQTGTSTMYNFETKEYGRTASFTAFNNYLFVMTSGSQNLGVQFDPRAGAFGRKILSCAGYAGSLHIESVLPGRVRVFAQNGSLIDASDIEASMPWRTTAPAGRYFITFASPRFNESRILVLQK